jgi:hypothetical protein
MLTPTPGALASQPQKRSPLARFPMLICNTPCAPLQVGNFRGVAPIGQPCGLRLGQCWVLCAPNFCSTRSASAPLAIAFARNGLGAARE